MDKAKQIELKLSVVEVNTILEAMGQLPFVKVYSLIEKIQQQAEQQLNDTGNHPQPGKQEKS